jgi:beta-lactamase class C
MRHAMPLTVLLLAVWGVSFPARAVGETPERQDSVARIVPAVVHPWILEFKPPGVLVVVRHDRKTEFFPFGEADESNHKAVTPDSIFELASITKVFTTTSLAMEVDNGKMRLDDSIAAYLPYLQQHGGDVKTITLRQLATHTSALPRTPDATRPAGGWNQQEVMDWLAHWQSPYPPGTKSLYSNVGIGLLGYAIAACENKPLIDVWDRQFLGPLEMKHTFFQIPPEYRSLLVQGYGPQGRPVERTPPSGWPAGGSLCSSGRDMGQFLAANLGELADRAAITHAMQLAQKPYFEASANMTQGLAWQRVKRGGELVIDKNGGLPGTSTYIGMLPDRHVGVVVMANRSQCAATRVGRKLLLALVGK